MVGFVVVRGLDGITEALIVYINQLRMPAEIRTMCLRPGMNVVREDGVGATPPKLAAYSHK